MNSATPSPGQANAPQPGWYVPNPDVTWTVIDGEAVLLDTSDGHYYTLNDVSTVVWECLADGRSRDDVLARLCERFEVDEAVADKDLDALMARLSEDGLVSPPGTAPTPK